MIVDIHVHYTQAPPQLDAYRGWQVSRQNKPAKGALKVSDEQLDAVAAEQSQADAGSRHRPRDLLAARLGHGPRFRQRAGEPLLDRDQQRSDRAGVPALSRQVPPRLPAAAIAGRQPAQLRRGARPLRQGARLHRLQHQSGRVRRRRSADPLARRQVVVSALGEDGRARHSRHGPCQLDAHSLAARQRLALREPGHRRRGRAVQFAGVRRFSRS